MVTKNELRIGLKFETDNKNLDASRQKLEELLVSAQKIKSSFESENWMGGVNLKKGFQEAAKEAEKLSGVLSKSWDLKSGQLNITNFKKEINQAYGGIQQFRTQLNSLGPAGTTAFNNIASSVLNTNVQLKQSSELLNKMALTFANTIRFGISSSIFNSFTGSLEKAYSYVKNLDTSLNDIRIVSGQTADQMERFAKYANQSAKELGASTLDYTKASLIYYQQGLTGKDVTDRTDITVKMANVLGTSTQEVSEYMTAIWNNFDDGSKSLEHYADVITALGASTASSAEEISEGLEKFAAVAGTVGLSYEYATSALATVVAETRQSADVVGTAFKTLFARIQDLELGETLEDGTTLGKYAEALNSVGISIKDSNGELKKMDTILNEMGSTWNTLNDAQKVALAQNVAGTRQYTQLIALMDNWETFQTNLTTAETSAGKLESQQEIYLESLEAHLQQLSTEAEKFYDTLLDEKSIKSFVDMLTGALKGINTYLTGLGDNLTGILGGNVIALFSKQLGSAAARMNNNFDIETKNRDADAFKQELANNIRNDYELNGAESPSDERVQAEAKYSLDLLQIRQNISKEEYEELATQQQIYGQLSESIGAAENWETNLRNTAGWLKEDEEYLGNINNLQLRSVQLSQQATRETEKLSDAQSAIDELMLDLNAASSKDRKDIIKSREQEINLALEVAGVEEEQRKGYIKDLADGKKLHSINKEINDKFQERQEEIDDLGKKSEAFNEAAKQYQKTQDGTLEKEKQHKIAIDESVRSAQQQAATAQAYQNLISGIAVTFSALQSLGSIIKILKMSDDEMSGWEKLKSIFAILIVQAPILLANWGKVTSIFSNFKLVLEKQNVSLTKRNALLTTETGLTKVNTAVKNENTSAEIKNTVADGANNTQRTTKTIPGLIAENTLLAIKNALMGNWVVLAAAAVAATVAISVAIVKYIEHVRELESEEHKLNESVKTNQELLEAAKNKYDEFKETLSSYTDAENSLNSLTEGTVEFYEALVKSNEAALKLIDTLNLVAGKDYIVGANGKIEISQEAIEKGSFEQNKKLLQQQAATTAAQYNLDRYKREQRKNEIVDEFTKDVNKRSYYQIDNDQGKKILENASSKTPIDIGQITEKNAIEKMAVDVITTLDKNEADNISAIEQNGQDISKSIEEWNPEFQKLAAEDYQQNRYVTTQHMLATMDQEETKKYNSMTDLQKSAVIDRYQKDYNEYDKKNREWANYYAGNFEGRMMNQINSGNTADKFEAGRQLTNKNLGILKYTGLGTALSLYGGYYAAKGGMDEDAKKSSEAYEKGIQIRAQKNGEKTLKTIFESIEDVAKRIEEDIPMPVSATSKSNITGALLKLQSDSFTQDNLKQLTAGEIYNLSGIANKDEIQNLEKLLPDGQSIEEYYKGLLDITDEWGRLPERIASDLNEYNNTLAGQAEALKTTKTALTLYAAALEESGDIEKSRTKDTAAAAAASYKFNKSYNDARKAYEDNADAIKIYAKAMKNGEKVSYDVADAVGEVVDQLKEMGIVLTSDDFKDAETLKQINILLTGTEKEAEKAYEALYTLSRLNALKGAFGSSEKALAELSNARMSFEDIIQAIDSQDVGQSLEKKYAQTLANMINATDMSIAQINELSKQLGIEIPISYNKPEKLTFETATFSTESQSVQHTYSGQMPNPAYDPSSSDPERQSKVIDVDYAWVETTTPKNENFTVVGDGNFEVKETKQTVGSKGNYKATATGKKGGSSSKPNKKEHIETDIDRYHKVNAQITKVDNALKKLESQQEKFVGSNLINNLNAQWNQLNIQISNYTEKLRIANDEQKELANNLSSKGVYFNSDGTVANYAEAIKAQEAYVNSLYDNYNKMSKSQQEKYEDTLKKAEKDFEAFKKDIDRYDELVTDFIPDLQQSVQDALDKQIEINVQKFNKEIEVTLDMNQATRDWNEWYKKNIKGFKDEDIFGNISTRLKNFNTYFNNRGNGDIQAETRHLRDILDNLEKMKRGQDNIFGNNESEGLDQLKESLDKIMNSIDELRDLENDALQDVLDKMDEVQEKFDKQIENYEYLRDLINHDIKLTQLLLGDDAYKDLEIYYAKQQQALKEQLEYAKMEENFWRERLKNEQLTEEERENATEKLKAAITQVKELSTAAIEATKDELHNLVNGMYKEWEEVITNGLGLSYINEQWDLINKNANRYLDTINSTYAIRELEKKYVDAINKTDNIGKQQRLKKVMDEQLTGLRERDRLTQYDVDRANKLYEIELARIALEEAQQNKSQMRLRRDSQGNYTYQYIADNDAITEAQNKVDDLYNSLYNFDKERFNSLAKDWSDGLTELEEKLKATVDIADPAKQLEERQLIIQQYNELLQQVMADYSVANQNLTNSAFEEISRSNELAIDSLMNASDRAKQIILEEYIPTYANGMKESMDYVIGEGGIAAVLDKTYHKMIAAEEDYNEKIKDLNRVADGTFDTIINGEDEAITEAQKLIGVNEEIINTYGTELQAVKDIYTQLKENLKLRERELEVAKQIAEEAYNYKHASEEKQAEEYKNQTQTTSSASGTPTPQPAAPSTDINTGGGSSGGGNGSPEPGEVVTYQGGRYYADSYGGGGSGSKKAGTQVKITIVKNGRPYPIHIATTSGGALGWIRQDQITGYDTGGYTGTWDNSGRLAMLHQKELVLNASDTTNMLNTVAIMRNLTEMLGSNVLARLAGASAASINSTPNDGALEQIVHIDAQFPNVRNSAEIEAALNNLVNSASQRIGERRDS